MLFWSAHSKSYALHKATDLLVLFFYYLLLIRPNPTKRLAKRWNSLLVSQFNKKKNPVFLLVAGPKKEKTEFLYLSKQDGIFFVPVIFNFRIFIVMAQTVSSLPNILHA